MDEGRGCVGRGGCCQVRAVDLEEVEEEIELVEGEILKLEARAADVEGDVEERKK